MILDYAENIVLLLANLIALLLCLFQYISHKKKGWICATAIFLSSLMSSYYWTVYLLIMGDTPNISNAFSYLGWNISYLFLLLLVLLMKRPEERRWFHPIMLLPVPLNIWQLTLYLPYGGKLNSAYQVAVLTCVACFSLQGICYYLKHRRSGAGKPYVAAAALFYTICEFGMWTSSCCYPPISYLYYPFSFLYSASFLVLVWALARTYRPFAKDDGADTRYQTILKAAYFVVVLICCVGGVVLGVWMKNVMAAGTAQGGQSNVYDIIPVVLFIISLFLVAFAVAIIFIVNFGEKVAENNALREARRIAEHSNEAKSEFLANMSHEIRTPINAVLGMNEMILREGLEARDRLPKEREAIRDKFADICDYAGNIESAGNNLLSIINDILDISKIEAGKLEILEADYQLSAVLNDVSNMIAFKARDKGLDFRAEVDGGLPDGLYGDEVRVRQIMINVLNNAVKYTRKGSVLFAVRGESDGPIAAGGQIRLKITVKDTGIGIRQEDLDRLFQKFERVDLQANSTVEGTGLGLAITYSLLTMMDGSIRVESEYGEGSTFTVTLPQKIVSCEAVGDIQTRFGTQIQPTGTHEETFRAPDARILIVDDTPMNLTVAIGLLKNTGMNIDTADGGEEALALTRTTAYDLILMDQRMPRMDGVETLHRLRAQAEGANRDTPVICLTADAIIGAKERYMAEGFTDYLTKPIDSQALEQMMTRYLPREKVTVVKRETLGAADTALANAGEDGYAPLRQAGISPEIGLRYCQKDENLYCTLLREYASEAEDKAQAFGRYFEAGDWNNYSILAHSLKSTSRTIGATALSQIAAKLEKAADENRADDVAAEHAVMLECYANTAHGIRAALQGLEAAVGDEGDRMKFGPDDNIMEFMPE